ncbi:hypothetical protein OUZ56_021597 [Daphnia magna]|uniref:Uncharacterized protein n=1 Tax=Daphnia magna TaxID=35525 RepID=A0ABR0AUG2_9CRUS|nr:hypothetical protein OUZ56_021597 [Daphnia magna]
MRLAHHQPTQGDRVTFTDEALWWPRVRRQTMNATIAAAAGAFPLNRRWDFFTSSTLKKWHLATFLESALETSRLRRTNRLQRVQIIGRRPPSTLHLRVHVSGPGKCKLGNLGRLQRHVTPAGHAFASLTAKRRENILKFTDPRFESLLKYPERFDSDECDELFGRSFLGSMVRDADNDAKLRNVNRPSSFGQQLGLHETNVINLFRHLLNRMGCHIKQQCDPWPVDL